VQGERDPDPHGLLIHGGTIVTEAGPLVADVLVMCHTLALLAAYPLGVT